MEVIVLGSINMDLVIKTNVFPKQGETVMGCGFFTSPGGKGANQAAAIGKMGKRPIFIGCVGNDLYGEELLHKLSENNVDISNINQVDESTGIAVITLYNNDNRIILNPGANHHLDSSKIKNILDNYNKDCIFLTQFENNIEVTLDCLTYAKSKGMITVLNPAPFIKTDLSVYSNLDFLILNESECSALVGFAIDSDEKQRKALDFLTGLGVRNIILTLGSKGSVLYIKSKREKIPVYPTEVVDTTCAGDAYIGAFISQIAQGEDYSKACAFASKVASLTVSKEGAQESIPLRVMNN